jgi:tRNA(Ile2) C34 agmatinyltransferase TiaS
MAKQGSFAIWTEGDRICDKCHARLASHDDWLCKECREAFEAEWLQLTTQGRLRAMPQEKAETITPHPAFA